MEIWDIVGDAEVLIIRFTGRDPIDQSYLSTSNNVYVVYRTSEGAHWDTKGFKLGYVISSVESEYVLIITIKSHFLVARLNGESRYINIEKNNLILATFHCLDTLHS